MRFDDSNVVGRARQFSETHQMMKEQFSSASKQQKVKAELSKLSYDNFLGKTSVDKRKSFKQRKEHIEKRIPLCPGTWRHETQKIEFLRDALVTEDRAENTLSRVGASTSWRGLCTELGNALQIRIEREGNHARRWEQQPILLPSHLFSSLPQDTQRRSARLCFRVRIRRFVLEL